MIHHLIIKKDGSYLMPLVRDEFPIQFMVQELADSGCNDLHWHTYIHTEWNDAKLRRWLVKRITGKLHYSMRPNDGRHFYLCKGNGPFKMPHIIKNTIEFMTDEFISEANNTYWQMKCQKLDELNGDKLLELKPIKIIDRLIEIVEQKELNTFEEISRAYIEIAKTNKKLLANYSLGRQYIRTASLYVKDPEENIQKIISFYKNSD